MGDVIDIPVFFDVDMTITSEYQQEPLIRKHEEKVRAKFKRLGLPFSKLTDCFAVRQKGMGGDRGITYLNLLIWDAQPGEPFEGLTNKTLRESGREVKPAKGLVEGLRALKKEFEGKANLHYFLVSMGIKPIIEGFVEAHGLEDIIEGIAASEFTTDGNDVINGIKNAVAAFNKNEWIISFMKGSHELVNARLFPGQYKFNYRNMVVVGDGFTDVAMFAYAKKKGGTPVGVYEPGSFEDYKQAIDTVGMWVDYIVPRDYSPDQQTFGQLKTIIKDKLERKCEFRPSFLYDYRKGNVRTPEETLLVWEHLRKCLDCRDFFNKVYVMPDGGIERHSVRITKV